MLHRVALATILATALVATSVFARDDGLANSKFGWAFVSKGSSVATTSDDLDRLDEFTSEGDRALFARLGDDEYLIRDRATLDRVDQLVEPIRRLGEKAREIVGQRGAQRGDKLGRREWKERLRPFKEKRRQLVLRVSGDIEALVRESVRRGHAQRLD